MATNLAQQHSIVATAGTKLSNIFSDELEKISDKISKFSDILSDELDKMFDEITKFSDILSDELEKIISSPDKRMRKQS